jgi:hypothetical protein
VHETVQAGSWALARKRRALAIIQIVTRTLQDAKIPQMLFMEDFKSFLRQYIHHAKKVNSVNPGNSLFVKWQDFSDRTMRTAHPRSVKFAFAGALCHAVNNESRLELLIDFSQKSFVHCVFWLY